MLENRGVHLDGNPTSNTRHASSCTVQSYELICSHSDFSGKAESLVWIARKGHWQLHCMTKCITTLTATMRFMRFVRSQFQQKLSNRAGIAGTEPLRPEISSKCKQFEGRPFKRWKLKLNNSHATFPSRRVQHMLWVYSNKIECVSFWHDPSLCLPSLHLLQAIWRSCFHFSGAYRPFGCTWVTHGRRKNKLRFVQEMSKKPSRTARCCSHSSTNLLQKYSKESCIYHDIS